MAFQHTCLEGGCVRGLVHSVPGRREGGIFFFFLMDFLYLGESEFRLFSTYLMVVMLGFNTLGYLMNYNPSILFVFLFLLLLIMYLHIYPLTLFIFNTE